MTSFTHKILTLFCLLAWVSFTLCISEAALASSGAGRGTAGTSTTGGIQSSATNFINSTQGYANQASGLLNSANQATSAVSGLANSLGAGNVLGSGTSMLGDAGSYLNQGQNLLNTAGNLSNLDFNSVTSGLGSLSNLGIGSLGGTLGQSAQNIMSNAGKYFDSVKGINLDSIWGYVTNLQKDLTGNIKQLISGEIANFDMTSLSSALTSAGVPVEYVDLGPVGVATVVYEGQIPIAMDSQYAATTDYSAAMGPIGNMDFRNGQCMYNGHDYTGMLKDYINGAGVANEGTHNSLYLDTNCWITVGIGSVMFQYSSPRNWAGYKAYFDKMEYVDKAGNPVSQAQKDADLKLFFDMEGSCRATCGCSAACDAKASTKGCCTNTKTRGSDGMTYCINKSYSYYANQVGGRQISNQAAGDAIFNELCNDHIPGLVKKSGGSYPQFNMKLQEVLLDISYQGGIGSIGNLMTRLKSGNCGTAVSSFSSSTLCTQFPGRCKWRLGALTSGCNMGVYSTAN